MPSKKGKSRPVPQSPPPVKERPVVPRALLGITDTPDEAHPSWRLSLLDLDHAGGWSWSATEANLREIVKFLSEMERLRWTEIRAQVTSSRRASHRKHHEVPTESLCREAQRRLQDLQLDEFDELFRFRLTGPKRLWGVVHAGVFYPLWWDPSHQVYPTEPG
jgi:hypothetical protein